MFTNSVPLPFASVGRAIGIVADKNGLAWTLLDRAEDGHITVVEELEIKVPAGHATRGSELAWLLAEARQLLVRLNPDAIGLRRPGDGASRERIETEGMVQLAAHEHDIRLQLLTTEGVRSRLNVPRGRGAFESMLTWPEVAARSNKDKRERYLFAQAVLP